MKIRDVLNMNRPENGQPDWAGLSLDEMNLWQQIAAATEGIVTPANGIDALRFAGEVAIQRAIVDGHKRMERAKDCPEMFLDGADQKLIGLLAGLPLAFVDKLDGLIADKTGTKSPLGEAVDGVGDFGITAMRLRARLAIGEMTPTDVLMIAGPKVVNAVASGVQIFRGKEVHSSIGAKGGEALRALTLAAFDATEIIKTRAQIEDVKNGFTPAEVMAAGYCDGLERYDTAVKWRDGLAATAFATNAAVSATNVFRAFRK